MHSYFYLFLRNAERRPTAATGTNVRRQVTCSFRTVSECIAYKKDRFMAALPATKMIMADTVKTALAFLAPVLARRHAMTVRVATKKDKCEPKKKMKNSRA